MRCRVARRRDRWRDSLFDGKLAPGFGDVSPRGCNIHALAQDWVARPLGIRIHARPREPHGIYFGGNGMLMSPPGALARFGKMYRNPAA